MVARLIVCGSLVDTLALFMSVVVLLYLFIPCSYILCVHDSHLIIILVVHITVRQHQHIGTIAVTPT